MVLTDEGVGFPVTDPATRFDNGGTIIDGEPVWNNAAPIHLAIAFLALLLAA